MRQRAGQSWAQPDLVKASEHLRRYGLGSPSTSPAPSLLFPAVTTLLSAVTKPTRQVPTSQGCCEIGRVIMCEVLRAAADTDSKRPANAGYRAQPVQEWHSSWLGSKCHEASHGVGYRPPLVPASKDLRHKGSYWAMFPQLGCFCERQLC